MVSRKSYCKTRNVENEPILNLRSNESRGVVKQTSTFYALAGEAKQCFSPKFYSNEIDNQKIERQDVCKRNKLDLCAPMVTRLLDEKSSNVNYRKKCNIASYTNPDMITTPPPHSLANEFSEKVSHSLSPKIKRKRKTLDCCKLAPFELNNLFSKSPCDQHVCELYCSKENKPMQPTSFREESPSKLECLTPEHHDNFVKRNSSNTRVSVYTINHGTPKAPQRRHRCNLVYSILDGNTEQVEMALNNGEDPNASLNVPEWVMGEPCRLLPILLASKLAYPTIVELLLKYGAVSNSVNNQGQNALHLLFSQRQRTSEFPSSNKDKNTEPVKSISIQKSWEDLESYFQSLPSLDNETYDVFNAEPTVTNESTFLHNFDLPDFKKYFLPKAKRSEQAIIDDIIHCTEILLKHGIHKTRKDILGSTPWDIASQNSSISNHQSLLEKLQNIDQSSYHKTKNKTKPSSFYNPLIQMHSNALVPIVTELSHSGQSKLLQIQGKKEGLRKI